MNAEMSSAYVAELRCQIAILSERCAQLAAEAAGLRAELTARAVGPAPSDAQPRPVHQ